jgi:hypothetical protein
MVFLDSNQSPTASTYGTNVAHVHQSEATESLSPHPTRPRLATANVSPASDLLSPEGTLQRGREWVISPALAVRWQLRSSVDSRLPLASGLAIGGPSCPPYLSRWHQPNTSTRKASRRAPSHRAGKRPPARARL